MLTPSGVFAYLVSGRSSTPLPSPCESGHSKPACPLALTRERPTGCMVSGRARRLFAGGHRGWPHRAELPRPRRTHQRIGREGIARRTVHGPGLPWPRGRDRTACPGAPRFTRDSGSSPGARRLGGSDDRRRGLARCSDRSCPTRWLGDLDYTRSDDLHAAFSAATFALWIATPLVAARQARNADNRYRRWSRRLGMSTLVALLLGGILARRPSQRWSGAAQRIMLASAFSWYPLAAIATG